VHKDSPEKIALQAIVNELRKGIFPLLAIPKVWFSEYEASHYLSFSIHALRAWRNRGSGGPPYYKVNGRILYHKGSLDDWIKTHGVRK
jgi:hypothetical protein